MSRPLFPLILLIGFLIGCGKTSSESPILACHPTKGRLTIAGKVPEGAQVFLVPVKEDPNTTTPRPHGTVLANGDFRMSTYGKEDGAPAGEYGLSVFWPSVEGASDQLKGDFNAPHKTGKKVTIKEGDNVIPPIALVAPVVDLNR